MPKTPEQIKQSWLAHCADYIARKSPPSWSQGTEKNPGAHAYAAAGWLKKEFAITIPDADAPAFREAVRILCNASACGQELTKLNAEEASAYYGKLRVGTASLDGE